MSAEEAVALLEREGGRRLATATPGNRAFDAAAGLRFYPCRCSWADPGYGGHEFLARTPRGGVTYIGLTARTGGISCGPKGYHYHRPDEPACLPTGAAPGAGVAGGRRGIAGAEVVPDRRHRPRQVARAEAGTIHRLLA